MNEELIGKKYGHLTILDIYVKQDGKKKRSFAKCKCDCGNIKEIRLGHIKSEASKSCGCLQKEKAAQQYIDLSNQHFGYLTAIKKVGSSKNGAQWLCKCECGNEKIVSSRLLLKGEVKSCGCQKSNMISRALTRDLVGTRFGKLIVMEKTEDIGKGATWKCKCDCGNIVNIKAHSLISGHTKSCGCSISRGEDKIEDIFKSHNINYFKQKTFPDLRGINNGLLRFDFCYYDKNNVLSLLEYQGVQHYYNTGLKSPIEHDKIKKEYCQKNNIPLIEILYTDFDKIDWDYIKEKCNL